MSRVSVVVVLLFVGIALCDPAGHIVDKSDPDITRFPFQVSIRYKNCSTCSFTHRCGGIVYSNRILITSANCVSGVNLNRLAVVAGSNSIIATEGVVVPVESFIIHEKYESLFIDYDIAIVILALELPFGSKEIAPVKLANELPNPGSLAYVTGWGSMEEGGEFSKQLKVSEVKIVSDDECKQSYGPGRITESMVCAEVVEGNADSCKGDSGGPLVVAKQLVGIVSWGKGCGRKGFPGVYANVVQLRDWIEDTVANVK